MTALTHFSKAFSGLKFDSRHPIEFNNPDIKEYMEYRSFLACDHLTFKLSQMNKLPKRCTMISYNIAFNSYVSSDIPK